MADLDKVIKGLKYCTECDCDIECPYFNMPLGDAPSCEVLLERDALTLLKNQEPIAPTIEVADLKALGVDDKDITSENIDKWTFRWCGNCNNLLLRTDKFCNKCGKQVKWE